MEEDFTSPKTDEAQARRGGNLCVPIEHQKKRGTGFAMARHSLLLAISVQRRAGRIKRGEAGCIKNLPQKSSSLPYAKHPKKYCIKNY
jgi:hypothetical protein